MLSWLSKMRELNNLHNVYVDEANKTNFSEIAVYVPLRLYLGFKLAVYCLCTAMRQMLWSTEPLHSLQYR